MSASEYMRQAAIDHWVLKTTTKKIVDFRCIEADKRSAEKLVVSNFIA